MNMRRVMVVLAGVLLPVLSWAAGSQVGMVLTVKGEVQTASKDFPDKKLVAKPLMLVQEGDHFYLPADGSLRMVFHANGRKETWQGKLHLQAGKEGQALLEGKGEPMVETLPPGVAGAVVQAPAWLASASRKTGGLVVRGIKENAEPCQTPPDEALSGEAGKEIQQALAQHGAMGRADPTDPVADLYLFGVYAKHGQYSKMSGLLKEIKQRPGAEPLAGELSGQMARLCR